MSGLREARAASLSSSGLCMWLPFLWFLVASVASPGLPVPLPTAELSTSVGWRLGALRLYAVWGRYPQYLFQVSLLSLDGILWVISNVCYHFGALTLSDIVLSTLHHLSESSHQPVRNALFSNFCK